MKLIKTAAAAIIAAGLSTTAQAQPGDAYAADLDAQDVCLHVKYVTIDTIRYHDEGKTLHQTLNHVRAMSPSGVMEEASLDAAGKVWVRARLHDLDAEEAGQAVYNECMGGWQ